jgi:TPR repeat protein
MRFLVGLFIFFAFSSLGAFAQNGRRAPDPIQDECPQGRQIRQQKAYPSTMSDCEVLDADTSAENQKLQRGPVAGTAPRAPLATTPQMSPRSAKSRAKYNLADAPVTECDTYAANPLDPARNADGITFDKIRPDLAVPACESAVQKNPKNIRLIYQLGRAYQKKGDLTSALAQYRSAADQGYAAAQTNLAFVYEIGQGVPKDEVQAAVWYRKAADQGYAGAQKALGTLYQSGRGVPKDDVQAVAWYRKAADQGYANAQDALGSAYQNGRGVPKDDVQAVAWYRAAAEQAYPAAQTNLGFMYDKGLGVPKDEVQAAAWYRAAAEQGYALAQTNLGFCYESGQGVKRDYVQAVAWYRKAAEQGFDVGQDYLGNMYNWGRGVPQNLAEAANWWRKAADQGNADAQKHLASEAARIEQDREYKRITVEDFILDGKELAAANAKVSVKGAYAKWGENEMIFPSGTAVYTAKESLSMDTGIGVLTDDATRNVRKYILDCVTTGAAAQFGCPMTVFARASMCTRTRLGSSKDLPCLIVLDGVSGQ